MDREGFHIFYASAVTEAAEHATKGLSYVEREDVEMTVWEALYKNFEYNAKLEPKNVYWLIRRKANEAVAKEKRDYEYFRGAFVYTPQIVRAILADAVWVDLEGVPDIDARIDVVRIFGELPLKQRQVLFRRYAVGDILTDAETKAATRAINKITDRLNAITPLEEETLDVL